MARIPSAEELGFRAPRAVAQGADTGGVISGRARAMDLKAVETGAAQKGLKELGDRIANEELATAEVQFQLGAMAEAEKYKNDPDLDTIEERHAAGMKDQLGKASSKITSAKTRAIFITRGEAAVARANSIQGEKTTARKNDREKGHMANAIDLMVKGGMDLQWGDPGTAAVGIQLTLDSMVERQVISAVDAQRTMKKAQLDMAYGRLKSMDPTQQLEILNAKDAKTQRWLEDVPPDVLRQLREQAEAAELNNVAQAYAFDTRGNENAVNDMYDLAQKEGWDADRIDKTRLRIMRLEQDDEVTKQRELEDYYEEGAAEIYAGTATLEMMEATPEGIQMLAKLSEAQRRNLVAAQDNAVERAAGKGRKYSDLVVKNRLKSLMASGQLIEGRKYWSENYASLNDSDFKYFNVATSPTKSAAPEFDPIRSARQLLAEHKKVNTQMTDDQESEIWDRIDVKSLEYFNDNAGKKAPDKLVNEWIEEEFIQIKHKENWWPDEEKFLYEMDDTGLLQRDEVVDQLDFLQKATGFSRSRTGDLMSGYAEREYEFVPKMNEALAVVRSRYPNEKPYQHWARIKNMLGIEKSPAPIGAEVLDAGGEAA